MRKLIILKLFALALFCSCDKKGVREGNFSCRLATIALEGENAKHLSLQYAAEIPAYLLSDDGSYIQLEFGTYSDGNLVRHLYLRDIGFYASGEDLRYGYSRASYYHSTLTNEISYRSDNWAASSRYIAYYGIQHRLDSIIIHLWDADQQMRRTKKYHYVYQGDRIVSLIDFGYQGNQEVLTEQYGFTYANEGNPLATTHFTIPMISALYQDNALLIYPVYSSDQKISYIRHRDSDYPVNYTYNDLDRLSVLEIPFLNIKESYLYTCR